MALFNAVYWLCWISITCLYFTLAFDVYRLPVQKHILKSTLNPSQYTSNTAGTQANTATAKLPLPFMDLESVGISGDWYEKSGNYVLRPKNFTRPLGVIHFLGGAFVGAAPHLTYKYLLESLSQSGYIIVATPYRLDMDYVSICDGILSKFEGVAIELASELGAVPVIGLGHSCGALLQTLITSLFPDTPRALNILISYNNKPASKAIPAFQEAIIPLAEQLMRDSEDATRARQLLIDARTAVDGLVDAYAASEFAPLFVGKELVPLLRQGLEIADQFGPLLKTIANGKHEFTPTPVDAKEVCRRMYRARKTLLLQFENDALDESADIERVLREANTIMRMKRPMVEMIVERRTIEGTHITPLTQNILADPPLERFGGLGIPFDTLSTFDIFKSARTQARVSFLKTIDGVRAEITQFLETSIGPQL